MLRRIQSQIKLQTVQIDLKTLTTDQILNSFK